MTKVATVSSGDLAVAGTLKLCADFPAPPGHFYSTSNQMTGYDIDLGNELAARLGLKADWVDSVFNTIILAAQTKKCDMIWSGMSITADREKVLSMLPYFSVGETLITAKGNPASIGDPSTDASACALCGHTIAAEQGSYELTLAKGFSADCTKAGKKAITIQTPQDNGTALQLVTTKHVDAWMTGSDLAGYVVSQHKDDIQTVGSVFQSGAYGLAIPPERSSLTSGVQKALVSMIDDGTYAKILKKWGQSATLTASDISVNPATS